MAGVARRPQCNCKGLLSQSLATFSGTQLDSWGLGSFKRLNQLVRQSSFLVDIAPADHFYVHLCFTSWLMLWVSSHRIGS